MCTATPEICCSYRSSSILTHVTTHDGGHGPLLAIGPIPGVCRVVLPVIFQVLKILFLPVQQRVRRMLSTHDRPQTSNQLRTFLSSGNADWPSPPCKTSSSFDFSIASGRDSICSGDGTWVPEDMVEVRDALSGSALTGAMLPWSRSDIGRRKRRERRVGAGTARESRSKLALRGPCLPTYVYCLFPTHVVESHPRFVTERLFSGRQKQFSILTIFYLPSMLPPIAIVVARQRIVRVTEVL